MQKATNWNREDWILDLTMSFNCKLLTSLSFWKNKRNRSNNFWASFHVLCPILDFGTPLFKIWQHDVIITSVTSAQIAAQNSCKQRPSFPISPFGNIYWFASNVVQGVFLSRLFVIEFAAHRGAMSAMIRMKKMRVPEDREWRKHRPGKENQIFSLLCSCGIFRSMGQSTFINEASRNVTTSVQMRAQCLYL